MRMWSWVTKPHLEKDKEVLDFQQRFKSSLLVFLAQCASFLSDEEFYLLSFPVTLWGPMCSTSPFAAFAIAQHLGWNLTLGSTFKNIIAFPRPTSPPVRRGNGGCEAIEFAMPSTHAFMSVCFAIRIVFHWLALTPSPTLFNYLMWAAFVLMWSLPIAISRVYLGFHSFQDIFVGWVFGSVWGFVMELFLIPSLYGLLYDGNTVATMLLCAFWLLWMIYHPINKKSKTAFHLSEGTFDYTPPIAAVAVGSSLGIYFIGRTVICSSDSSVLYYRYIYGLPLLIYFGSRFILPPLIESIFKLLKVDCHYIPYRKFRDYVIENTKNPNSTTNEMYKMAWVRYTSKFFQYTLVTLAVLVPLLSGFDGLNTNTL